ncbi:hypothetical protein MHY1_01420 [Methylovirgula sp. HY1]|nr:hypothetical protein MHY1_01420 [Methylovirgula sp. HY1]
MSNFAFLAAGFPNWREAMAETGRQTSFSLPYGNINGTIWIEEYRTARRCLNAASGEE